MISISIICSFYKMDKFYKYFLESVVNQIGFKNNIELVICLNKPSKQVVNLTNKFKTKYKKIFKLLFLKI